MFAGSINCFSTFLPKTNRLRLFHINLTCESKSQVQGETRGEKTESVDAFVSLRRNKKPALLLAESVHRGRSWERGT